VDAWPRPEPIAPPRARRDPAAERALHVIAGGIVIFLLGAGGLGAAYVHHHRRAPATSGTVIVSVGPERATPIARYLAERSPVLAKAHGHVTAVVSFASYVPDDKVGARLSGLHHRRLLVAAPGGNPDVTTDVTRWRTATAAQAAADARDLEQAIPTLDQDPDFQAVDKAQLAADQQIIAALDHHGAIVFGAVVDGDADALRALAKHHDIRLVDVAPSAAQSDDVEVRGLRPEETVSAGDPEQRPA